MCFLQKMPILDVTANLQISCAVTAQLNSDYVLATFIVQSLYCINLNFNPLFIVNWKHNRDFKTWSEIPKPGFLMTRLIIFLIHAKQLCDSCNVITRVDDSHRFLLMYNHYM